MGLVDLLFDLDGPVDVVVNGLRFGRREIERKEARRKTNRIVVSKSERPYSNRG